MEAERVYFSKNFDSIFKKLDFSKFGKKVGIKVHFGEKGCRTFVNPDYSKRIYEKLKQKKEVSLIETNVLYRGSRTIREEHVKLAREHGFFGKIDILDGEKGEEFIGVEGKKLGKGLRNYDSLVVLSHFKGHVMAGFGGAIKNLAMGLASRAGKLQMHSSVSPIISDKCIGCGVCVKNCNAKAISLANNKARIEQEKCLGCAMCIAVCPENAIKVPWHGTTIEKLQKSLVEYAEAVFKIIPRERIIFINVLENITKDCDCVNSPQEPLIEDIGILAGEDIVAVEKASIDLINEKAGRRLFESRQIDFAKRKFGDKAYRLINLDEL